MTPPLQVARGAVTAADGVLLVDKPAGCTSHDVVGMTRRMAATRKVGHAGTLDPMATGLLVLGVGRATRLLTYLVGMDKTYEATIRLGQETLTEDAEGEVTSSRGCPVEDASAFGSRLARALGELTGQVQQVPSAVSAIKVGGVRSYKRVRDGQKVELSARPVTVYRLEARGEPRVARAADGTRVVDLDVSVSCSSGTYVRAIARDLGIVLGCGGHLTALRRTAVGPFEVAQADGPRALSAAVEADAQLSRPCGLATLPLGAVARRCFPALALNEAQARAVSHGQYLSGDLLEAAVPPADPAPRTGTARSGPVVAAFAPDGGLVALLSRSKGRARPVLVLAPAGAAP